jgi:hypothetical protein
LVHIKCRLPAGRFGDTKQGRYQWADITITPPILIHESPFGLWNFLFTAISMISTIPFRLDDFVNID